MMKPIIPPTWETEAERLDTCGQPEKFRKMLPHFRK